LIKNEEKQNQSMLAMYCWKQSGHVLLLVNK
jgi:hypothetical protein